jgi:hypothetical protein
MTKDPAIVSMESRRIYFQELFKKVLVLDFSNFLVQSLRESSCLLKDWTLESNASQTSQFVILQKYNLQKNFALARYTIMI